MQDKISVMDLKQLEKAKILIGMSADLSETRKNYLFELIDARKELLRKKAK